MKKQLIKLFWVVDHFFEKHRMLVFLLALVIFLRIPSYFEPYWYGDEAIYLTVGNALNQGKTLYRDIVDHKTPIIYYLARVPNQLSFRLLLTLWMIPTAISFYYLAKQFLKNQRLGLAAAITFIVATSLPTFEGLIPNGELFVLGFFLPGLALLYSVMSSIKLQQYPSLKISTFVHLRHLIALARCTLNLKKQVILIVAGMLFGCAILTKVPAVFDVVAAYLLVAFTTLGMKRNITTKKINLSKLVQLVVVFFWITLGLLTPILLSIVYFTILGAFNDYLAFGLLYNLHYTGTWIPTSSIPLASLFFSLKGKLIILFGITSILFLLRKKIPAVYLFAIAWTWWSLVAASLSNRPYPHYFIQVIPAIVLLIFGFADAIKHLIQAQTTKHKHFGIQVFLFLITIGMLVFTNLTLGLWSNRYSSTLYYQRFFALLSKSLSYTGYQDSFDALVADNRQVANEFKKTQPQEIFIWGTNPSLYAQTHTSPTDKFTVLFHVADLGVYDQTIANVINHSPQYIVVMKNAEKVPATLQRFIANNYLPLFNLENMAVWQKQTNRY